MLIVNNTNDVEMTLEEILESFEKQHNFVIKTILKEDENKQLEELKKITEGCNQDNLNIKVVVKK